MLVKVIHGVRICRHCKGICHKGAYRTRGQRRKSYFCSKQCAEQHGEFLYLLEQVEVLSK